MLAGSPWLGKVGIPSYFTVLSSCAKLRNKLHERTHTRIAPVGQGRDAVPRDKKGKRLEETGCRGGDQLAELLW